MAAFFDIRTLSMMSGLTSITLAAVMIYFSLSRRTYPGFKRWTAGFVFGGLGMVLISLRQFSPDWLSVVVANGCIMAFPAMLSHGLAAFSDAPRRFWLPGTTLAVAMTAMAYYIYWLPNVTARIVIVSLSVSAILAFNFLLLFKLGRLRREYNNHLLHATFTGLAIWFLARAVMTWLWGGEIEDFFSASALQGISFMVYTLGSVLMMSGLIALNAQRMEMELASAGRYIENLSRLVPICSACKKIRDDQGAWEAVESYIQKRTRDDLTHSICPECIKVLYPDLHPHEH